MKSKTIWITGASSGIGEALALESAKRGYKVILSSRSKDKLEVVKEACQAHGTEALVVPLDLSDPESITAAVDRVKELKLQVDILVNNGGLSQRSFAVDTPIENDRKIFEINYFGTVNLTKQILGGMIARGSGHVAVVTSISGKFGFPLRSAYIASKHALHGFFESLYLENKITHNGINVTILIPGRVQTNISVNALDEAGNPSGKMDKGQKNGIPADKCARKMLSAIEKNKREVLIGSKEILMVYIRKFLPFLFFRIARKVDPR